MRMFLVGLSAALLAGCGSVPANNSSGNAVAPGNAAAPATPAMPTNMVLPGGEGDAAETGNGMAAGGSGGGNRAQMLAECTQEATSELPAGTDAAGLCGCAVDRVMAGAGRGDAMRLCATERNVRLPGGPQ